MLDDDFVIIVQLSHSFINDLYYFYIRLYFSFFICSTLLDRFCVDNDPPRDTCRQWDQILLLTLSLRVCAIMSTIVFMLMSFRLALLMCEATHLPPPVSSSISTFPMCELFVFFYILYASRVYLVLCLVLDELNCWLCVDLWSAEVHLFASIFRRYFIQSVTLWLYLPHHFRLAFYYSRAFRRSLLEHCHFIGRIVCTHLEIQT